MLTRVRRCRRTEVPVALLAAHAWHVEVPMGLTKLPGQGGQHAEAGAAFRPRPAGARTPAQYLVAGCRWTRGADRTVSGGGLLCRRAGRVQAHIPAVAALDHLAAQCDRACRAAARPRAALVGSAARGAARPHDRR